MSIPPEQADVAAFLAGLAGRPAHETHISAVFIGTDTVWKLKKAVRLSFLDFSTVSAREHYLRRELEINHAAAPGLYRDVVPVGCDPDGHLALGLKPAVDWVLRMARVPDADFLEAIAARGDLTPALLDALGDAVVRDQALRPAVSTWDSAAALSRIAAGNAESAMSAGLPRSEVTVWLTRTQAAIDILRGWLADRVPLGCVRRCHGDLHLGNLCLWQGKPVAFDALEFDEAMATIDIGYDLAFLLMDLEHRVSRPAANRVMNRALARTGDVGMMRGLPVFLSLRAMVRAHIAAAMGKGADAASYLAAAQAYLTPPPPRVLAIGGLQGTGKSTLARRVAPALGCSPGAVILRSDEVRKRLFGRAPEDRLPPEGYAEDANRAVNAGLVSLAQETIAGGHSVIIDATLLDPDLRNAVRAAAEAASVPFVGVWLQAPLAELERRVTARRDDASDATIDVLRRAADTSKPPQDWRLTDAMDLEAAAREVLAACRSSD
ncbi:AAA family ATPase [Rhodopila sp.]|jgi:aminoglycoside phosphotransferase family enzyme/predicted kinase|uniref:bifunctional aminoglycoside phosphotransferase/ATP-binding protein n=1 Tax=Rhodopila sp. TaxID=2480087 RepID=UPI002C92ACE6|nr:AAA family ATPase [Rhodopila sp.]HVZ08304.1 AAA family ATPase [Rhodopila sp.]